MMYALTILVLFIAVTCPAQTKSNNAKPPVKVLPKDSGRYKMPVKKPGVKQDKMPVINPDTSRVIPK